MTSLKNENCCVCNSIVFVFVFLGLPHYLLQYHCLISYSLFDISNIKGVQLCTMLVPVGSGSPGIAMICSPRHPTETPTCSKTITKCYLSGADII